MGTEGPWALALWQSLDTGTIFQTSTGGSNKAAAFLPVEKPGQALLMCRDSPIYKSWKQDLALPDKGLFKAQEEGQNPQEHPAWCHHPLLCAPPYPEEG